MIEIVLAALSLAIWLVLVFARGWFWRIGPVDEWPGGADLARVSVTALVPARNEAEFIATSVGSLLAQDFPGRLRIVVVDDQSTDGTGQIVDTLAGEANGRLRLVRGQGVLPGWTGKLSALAQGLAAIADDPAPPDYFWFTDADIVHAPDSLSGLVAGAEAKGAVLVSLMAQLRCESMAERWLVPAFVFFFRKLYPFGWVSNPRRRTSGAAGGCSLVRREALAAAGGLEAIRSSLIDDCALGAIMKKQGPTLLRLTHKVLSIRPYPQVNDIADMVTRSAYAQLGYSPLNLLGTIIGMVLIYLVPPVLAIAGNGIARPIALAAYMLMIAAYVPMLHFYRLSWWRALVLPLVAGLYTLFTIDSAIQHAMARGGAWKGRFQAQPSPGKAR